MTRTRADGVIDFVQDRVGDGLRTAVVLREDGYEIRYLRDDLRKGYSEEVYEEVVDSFRLESAFKSPGEEVQPIGERRAIVHYHDNAFVLQFPISETESILISLSPDAGRDLLEFIDECRRRIAR